jgi:DnaJ-class molecular chaperone
MNYYELLAVDRDATEAEIRTAYRRLVQDHHPDHSGEEDAVNFRKVQEAYEALSNPQTRAAYNRSLSATIPVRVVSRPLSESVYEVDSRSRSRSGVVQEVRRSNRFVRSVRRDFFRLIEEFFGF